MSNDNPLSTDTAERIARCFQALSDPNRLRILDLLRRQGETSVWEIAAGIGSSQQNVSKHLSILRTEGLVARRKVGTSKLYRLDAPRVVAWLDEELLEVGRGFGERRFI